MTSPESGLSYDTLMGITLKSLRRKNNIKQTDLMEKAEVSRATWSKIENGQSSIDFQQLATVVTECFGLQLNEFFSYMDQLDNRLQKAIDSEAKEKDMDSSHWLTALGALGMGALVGFLAKLVIDELDDL